MSMAKPKHSDNSDKSKFLSEYPSCSSQYGYNNYLQYTQNGTNTISNNKQDLFNDHNLYRNPEIFNDDQQETGDLRNASKSLANNWTDQYWLKKNEIPASTQRSHCGKRKVKKPINNIEKTLNQMLAQPAEMSKGKSLLEKMGWKGGGLGKDEDGIVDPIAPKATYANQTMGLGLLAENKKACNGNVKNKDKKLKKIKNKSEQPQLKQDELEFQNHFRTKVLLKILEFVKDTSKTEFQFAKMTNTVRKRVHHLVENVRECDNPELLDFDNEKDKEIVGQIMIYNNYILKTESQGIGSRRRLHLYKEAPENVYLLTPDYLREKIEENKNDIQNDITKDNSNNVTTTTNEKKAATNQENKIQINDGNKPIDKTENDSCDKIKLENGRNDLKGNVDCNLDLTKETEIDINKKQDGDENELNSKIKDDDNNEKEKCLEKIIEYFRDFVDDMVYKEFRFLGDFNNDENDAIKLFFDICLKMPVECEGKSELVQILNNVAHTFNIEEDANETLIINKLQN